MPGLHAKVVVGNKSALIGSANLTEAGVGKRQEMAVVLDDSTLVGQLRTWFDSLWRQCQSVPAADLESFVAMLPRTFNLPHQAHLESPVPRLSATVVSEAMAPEATSRDEARLCKRLAKGVSREWVNAYLDMCADLLTSLKISEDDARLGMSIPRGALSVILNQRYVLCAFHQGRKVIGMMLPRDTVVPAKLVPRMKKVPDRLGSFDAWRDEPPQKVPRFGYFEVEDPRELLPLRDAWLRAILQETERPWRYSSFRRYHVPAFFRVVVDQEYRRNVLTKAFSDS